MKSTRIHIGIFGRRNVGKSSLLNSLTRQETSLVSDVAGTTTDPVEKPMEFMPLGGVLFIDTAGIDDVGSLGDQRVAKTKSVFDRTEIAVLVVDCTQIWSDFENSVIHELKERGIPFLVVFNKSDLNSPQSDVLEKLKSEKIEVLVTSVLSKKDWATDFREAIIKIAPEHSLAPPPIVSDLVKAGDCILLVTPIDKEAPKGRLILPQVQTIRDILDGNCFCVVAKENMIEAALNQLKQPPALVVTDSQAFDVVSNAIPKNMPLTSFSILFARQKGDLTLMAQGAKAIGKLKQGSRVLIAESCSHHPIAEDIGTVKIPNLLRKYVGGELDCDLIIKHVQGHDFPTETLADWDIVIHCGACMWNRKEMLSRIMHCEKAGVPITNYGLAIAFMHGIIERALEPF